METVVSTPTPLPSLAQLAFNPFSVVGGQESTGTVWLRGPAPSSGAVVTLSSNAPAVVVVPATITVPAGAWTASFAFSTKRVARMRTVGITASYNGGSVSAKLTATR